MATTSYCGDSLVQSTFEAHNEEVEATCIWQEAMAWLVQVPILFITVSGWISADTTPLAFRFTAMADDSTGRKLVRLVCSVLILFLISTRFRAVLDVCRRSKLLLLIPALSLISICWSQSPPHTLIDALTLFMITLFAIYLYLRYPGDRLLSILTIGAFIALLLCVLSVTVFPVVGIDPYHENAWRAIFYQRNNCALTCTLFLVVGLHAPKRGLVEQLIRGSVIVLSLLFVIMSASRTGWLLATLALILTYGTRLVARMRSLDRLLFLMVIAVPTVALALVIANNFTQVLAAMDKDPTMTQRTVIWAETIPSILKHPYLGYGYSAFWRGLNGESMQAVLVTGWMEGQAQDGYLDILLQLGLVGLVPVMMLFARAGMHAVAAMERRMLNRVTLWAIVFLPVLLVGNIGESTILLPLGSSWFYALIAFLILARPEQYAETR